MKRSQVSGTHMVALTTEGLVFTWGEGKKGQLGHGQVPQHFISFHISSLMTLTCDAVIINVTWE